MLAWQQRVVAEKEDLDKRLRALVFFTMDGAFERLPAADQDLLLIQRAQMASLSWTLGARINRFSSQ